MILVSARVQKRKDPGMERSRISIGSCRHLERYRKKMETVKNVKTSFEGENKKTSRHQVVPRQKRTRSPVGGGSRSVSEASCHNPKPSLQAFLCFLTKCFNIRVSGTCHFMLVILGSTRVFVHFEENCTNIAMRPHH